MEVHAHSHTPRKKWTHYLWEFLMLFLAVFCGFLAEYKLEQTIEKHRAHEFAASMSDDLKEDTAQLAQYAYRMNIAVQNADSFLHLLAFKDLSVIPTGTLYYYGLFGGTPNTFLPNDATIQQMKGSGNLRLFTNKSVREQVARYDRLLRELENRQDRDAFLFTEVRKARARIFLTRYNNEANDVYQAFMEHGDTAGIRIFTASQPPILTYDKSLFNEYAELVRSRFLSGYIRMADTLKNEAGLLLETLKKEYHL